MDRAVHRLARDLETNALIHIHPAENPHDTNTD